MKTEKRNTVKKACNKRLIDSIESLVEELELYKEKQSKQKIKSAA